MRPQYSAPVAEYFAAVRVSALPHLFPPRRQNVLDRNGLLDHTRGTPLHEASQVVSIT